MHEQSLYLSLKKRLEILFRGMLQGGAGGIKIVDELTRGKALEYAIVTLRKTQLSCLCPIFLCPCPVPSSQVRQNETRRSEQSQYREKGWGGERRLDEIMFVMVSKVTFGLILSNKICIAQS